MAHPFRKNGLKKESSPRQGKELNSQSKDTKFNPRTTKRQRIKKYDLVSRWPRMGGYNDK